MRVKLSAQGLALYKHRQKVPAENWRGTIIPAKRNTPPHCLRIKWDHMSEARDYHQKFLEGEK